MRSSLLVVGSFSGMLKEKGNGRNYSKFQLFLEAEIKDTKMQTAKEKVIEYFCKMLIKM